ncbi:MAG: TIM barrel protein [Oscillospiraceae bacterium]|nr:TIM barrel protein [Oscillospiraceae bacterium]MDD4413257.1 TIM barrel protein [Oscillospiraceae bacterium]
MVKRARFGPAGNSEEFFASGRKSTLEAPEWLAGFGLNAYEYQGGHGINVREETARDLGSNADKHGIALSVHAPYYISLASDDPLKRDNSLRYILQSAQAVSWMGGERIIVHPGGLGGLSRSDAAQLAGETLKRAQELLDDEGLSQVHICPETMGKINQLGDLDEVLGLCELDERFIPCVDFGHLNSRTGGGMSTREEFTSVLDAIAKRLGVRRASEMHIHFSKIEYTDAGEKKHLTFEDSRFGPEPDSLMELIAKRGWTPTVICESRGTQDADARILKLLYEGYKILY